MKKNNKLSVADTVIGEIYPASLLGRCTASECPCCKRALKDHDTVVAVPNPSVPTGKSLVGVGCHPEVSDLSGHKVELKWRTSSVNPALTRGMIMRATQKYARRDVSVHAGYVTLTLWVPDGKGAQQVAKIPSTMAVARESIRMRIDETEWMPYDSETVTVLVGKSRKYQGTKAYGV